MKKMANVNERKQLQDKSLTLPTDPSKCVNRGTCLECLVLHYVNSRETHNHTPNVPKSVAM